MIYIDTGAFLGRFITRDSYHDLSDHLWEQIKKNNTKCFTSNFVLDETLTLMGRRVNYHFAAERALTFFEAKEFTILRPDEKDEKQALEFFKKYADQKVSFTDCISFALMKAYKIKKVFSFDQHFERAGFILWT